MPELSRFFGIIIRMFMEPDVSHHKAHFHAYYGEHVAIFSLDSLEVLGGSLPKRQQRLVEAWAELHIEELQTAWHKLQDGIKPDPIDPLKK